MTVVAVHPDSAALGLHMEVGNAEFRQFGDLVDLPSIDVYGEVSDAVLERRKFFRHDLVPVLGAVGGGLSGGWLGAVVPRPLLRPKEN